MSKTERKEGGEGGKEGETQTYTPRNKQEDGERNQRGGKGRVRDAHAFVCLWGNKKVKPRSEVFSQTLNSLVSEHRK